MKRLWLSTLLSVLVPWVHAQTDPGGAFLRSLAVPGWGHYAIDPQNWMAGKRHLAADVILIAAYLGYQGEADRFGRSLNAQAHSYARFDLTGRSRSFRIALADYDNLAAYNDAMERSRNWDRILPDIPENRWQWSDEDARRRFIGLINDEDAAANRLPAIAAMLVANRVFAGIGAYRRAQMVSLSGTYRSGAPTLSLRVEF
jgi:hypothetical protein